VRAYWSCLWILAFFPPFPYGSCCAPHSGGLSTSIQSCGLPTTSRLFDCPRALYCLDWSGSGQPIRVQSPLIQPVPTQQKKKPKKKATAQQRGAVVLGTFYWGNLFLFKVLRMISFVPTDNKEPANGFLQSFFSVGYLNSVGNSWLLGAMVILSSVNYNWRTPPCKELSLDKISGTAKKPLDIATCQFGHKSQVWEGKLSVWAQRIPMLQHLV